MARIKRGKIVMIIIIVVFVFFGGVFLWLSYAPQFGGAITEKYKERYRNTPHYKGDQFVNTKKIESHIKFSFKDFREGIGELISPSNVTKPKSNLQINAMDSMSLANHRKGSRLFWFGHSTLLLQTGTKNILMDPMFGEVPSPVSWVGTSRFNTELPIEIEKLPKIDAVVISHDHYDHLDYGSILKLKDKVKMFYVPLGVGVHLERWGVNKERIVELDWWDSVVEDGVAFRCMPSQHFSGRKVNTNNSTLWCSWIIQSEEANVYFSGDGGYSTHFKQIGEKYGPFDIALVECGQYNEKWPYIHMFPEQSVQAGIDVQAKVILPIHWGAFSLSQHDWNEPVKRFVEEANRLKANYVIPFIGESVDIQPPNETKQNIEWWKKL
ncbi:MBL fold metallo-hydrolase [Halosquirtibacter xylanolyticus]|uniref:MBL fold metallo-hydrolase n=1 Tax=Halosquirtibacter xylanolyticus TaxID=3374599 RepID=UPI003748C8A7|nr:MBL fold metallo-hydrolase [Prolixibacteraceae bacterium]